MSKKSNDRPSVWNNEMVNSALKSMSASDLEHYKKLGESLYKDLNFETSNGSFSKSGFEAQYLCHWSRGLKICL